MANTYSQVHLHFIFAPKFRQALISPAWETALYKYITGIVEARQHKMIAINGMSDHVHMLIGFRTTQSIGDFMQDVRPIRRSGSISIASAAAGLSGSHGMGCFPIPNRRCRM